jgi:hypothetical protein
MEIEMETVKTQMETISALVKPRKESQKELTSVLSTTVQRIRWSLQDSIDSLGIKELEIERNCTFRNNRFRFNGQEIADTEIADHLELTPVELIEVLQRRMTQMILMMENSTMIADNARVIAKINALVG